MRYTVIPNNEDHWLEMRCKVITSTEVAALFGISPYTTAFELFHRKKNQQYVKLEANERMKLGTVLQDSIAHHIAAEQNWHIRRMNEFIFDDELRIGASFDFMIQHPDVKFADGGGEDFFKPIALLEVKNVDNLVYKNDWIPSDTGAPQAPLHIECQVQMEMLVSGMEKCWIGACVGGNHIEMIERTADKRVQDAIIAKCAEFWASVDAGIEPLPNFQEDAEFITSLYGFSEPNTVVDVSTDDNITVLAYDYKKFGDEIKALESNREATKAQLLMAIGTNEKAIGNGFNISAGMVAATHVEYDRAAYRGFRVNWKKAK